MVKVFRQIKIIEMSKPFLPYMLKTLRIWSIGSQIKIVVDSQNAIFLTFSSTTQNFDSQFHRVNKVLVINNSNIPVLISNIFEKSIYLFIRSKHSPFVGRFPRLTKKFCSKWVLIQPRQIQFSGFLKCHQWSNGP